MYLLLREATECTELFTHGDVEKVVQVTEDADLSELGDSSINLANRNVIVLQTRTIPQGIAAMLAYDAKEERTTRTGRKLVS